MADLITPAQMAERLGIDPSAVRRLADRYNIGTKLGPRMRVYTEEDVMVMRQHSTGVAGRPEKVLEHDQTLAALAYYLADCFNRWAETTLDEFFSEEMEKDRGYVIDITFGDEIGDSWTRVDNFRVSEDEQARLKRMIEFIVAHPADYSTNRQLARAIR